MSESLSSLAYFSRNAIDGDPAAVQLEIGRILASARRNNARLGVTGALVYSDGCFAQVLEGEREHVEAVFESIQCDPRHRDVTILHLHEVERRSFGEWSMAFGGIAGVSAQPAGPADGLVGRDDILATVAGRNLLAVLTDVVYRDDVARREGLAAG